MTLPPFRFDVVKTYPPRGPLQLFRTATSTAFMCFRCSGAKTAKLVATIGGDGSNLLCNGCYGYLSSVWGLHADGREDPDRDRALLELLAGVITSAEVERGRALLIARDTGVEALSEEAQTLLATAEAVSAGLVSWRATSLDWSAAALPLCKAVEIEVVRQIVWPLAAVAREMDLSADASNPRLRPVVRFCQGDPAHLMLGVVTGFLRAVGDTGNGSPSPLADAMRRMAKSWPGADWIFAANGLPAALEDLRKNYRNRAAHTELLSQPEFDECHDLVAGREGLLWRLLVSTAPR